MGSCYDRIKSQPGEPIYNPEVDMKRVNPRKLSTTKTPNSREKSRKSTVKLPDPAPVEAKVLSHLEAYLPVKHLSQKLEEKYTLNQELSRSSAGITYFVINRATKLPHLLRKTPRNEEQIVQLEVELKRLAQLDHPNILKPYELLYDLRTMYVVSEVMPGRSLLTVQQISENQPEDVKANIMIQLLEAVRYYQGAGVVHGNLSPTTILFCDTTNLGSIRVKIIQFALTRRGPEENLRSPNSPIVFSAPEMLQSGEYTEKADIWSCGVLLYTLLSGKLPFIAIKKRDFCEVIAEARLDFTAPAWKNISPDAVALIAQMLNPTSSERPSPQQCLSHTWLSTRKTPAAARRFITTTLRNLISFKSAHKQQMRILSVISMQVMSQEEKQPLIEAFRMFDMEGDGRLSESELAEAMKWLFPEQKAHEAAERVMQMLDLDNNGFLDFSEFLIAASDLSVLLSNQKLKLAFDLFDEDKSGSISVNEFRRVLKVGEDSALLDKLIRVVDKNKDGELSFVEFKKLIKLAVAEATGWSRD